uniref:Peptidase_S9_N domain-containing protein n=1 Tax=Mesocestoides corti TaxID=53468 RepID=A0A5K3F172_MESCO
MNSPMAFSKSILRPLRFWGTTWRRTQQLRLKMIGSYPVFSKDEAVVDDFFGTKVADPYRWLENPDSDQTKAFIDAENAITMPYLNCCPYREQMKTKISELWDYEKYQCPFKRGSRYFYFYNSGLQNQSVLYVMESLKGPARVFFDPNALSSDGLVSLNTYGFSKDGEYFAYGLSKAGSDWVTIRVRKVATGEDLEDKLDHVKFTGINWTHDNKGFFYGCYPDAAPNADGKETDSNENQKLMYHRLGQPQSEDVLCVEWPDNPKFMSSAEVSDCGRYVFVSVHDGCERNNLFYFTDLEKIGYKITGKLEMTPILDKFEAVFDYVTNEGRKVVIQTDLNAPMFKLITVDLDNPSRENWTDLIPHDESCLLDWAACVNNKDLVVCFMKDVCNRLSVYALETGAKVKDIPIDIGSVSSFSGRKEDTMMFFQFTSFLVPGVSYSYDLTDVHAKPEVVFETEVKGLDLSNFEARQVFYQSKDGTRVPMFIMHR